MRPLPHRVGHDGVDADRGEQQPDQPEGAHEHRGEPETDGAVGPHLLQAADFVDRLRRIEAPHRLAAGARERRGIAAVAQDQHHVRRPGLRVGHVEGRRDLVPEPVVADVAHDAHDRLPGAVRGLDAEALADRALARPGAIRHRLADDRDVQPVRGVGGGEVAAFEDADPQRVEVAGRDDAEVGRRPVPAIEDRLAFDVERARRVTHRAGDDVGEGRAVDAAHARDVGLELLEEGALLVDALGAAAEQRHAQRHHAVLAVAVVSPQHVQRAADAQPGGDQQRERERHFDDHHRVAQPVASTARGRAAARLQRVGERHPRGAQRRQQPEDQRAGHREPREAEDQPQIDVELDPSRG